MGEILQGRQGENQRVWGKRRGIVYRQGNHGIYESGLWSGELYQRSAVLDQAGECQIEDRELRKYARGAVREQKTAAAQRDKIGGICEQEMRIARRCCWWDWI